jgi:chorismate mutase
MKKVCALRGATKVRNEADDIVRQLSTLYDRLLVENDLVEDDIISIVFSVTSDITAKNPAAALRASGHAMTLPLFSTTEPNTTGALPSVIRLIMHCYREAGQPPHHIYQNGAEVLRPDFAKR